MPSTNLIVVGVDGSKESRQALQWACEEAKAHHQEILAVSAWTPPPLPVDPAYGSFPWGTPTEPPREMVAMINEAIDEVVADYPEVPVRRRVVSGNAALELIELSDDADLVVVGAKGHGGFTGMLIGSVSQHVLAHSRCTVAVVR